MKQAMETENQIFKKLKLIYNKYIQLKPDTCIQKITFFLTDKSTKNPFKNNIWKNNKSYQCGW